MQEVSLLVRLGLKPALHVFVVLLGRWITKTCRQFSLGGTAMGQLLKNHCRWPGRAGGCPEPGHTEAASVDRLQQAVRKCGVWIAWVSKKSGWEGNSSWERQLRTTSAAITRFSSGMQRARELCRWQDWLVAAARYMLRGVGSPSPSSCEAEHWVFVSHLLSA